MHSSLAISRTPPQSGIPKEMTGHLPWAFSLDHRKHVKIYLKRETHYLQSYTCIPAKGDLRHSWNKIESRSNSCSLGMVCRSGPRSEDLSELLRDGFVGMPLPGAIAVIGCDLNLLENLTKLCQAQARPYRIKTASQGWVPFELPPILMLVDASDRSLVEAIKTAEELQILDVDIEIAIASGSDGEPPVFLTERIRRFFETHLVRHFPRIF